MPLGCGQLGGEMGMVIRGSFMRQLVWVMVVGLMSSMCQAQTTRVYFGTYTSGESKGIYRSELDLATGKLAPIELAAETTNPSFLAIHPNHKFLYAVSEIADFEGKKVGAVASFAIQPDGNLTLNNRQPSGGAGPCHLVVDATGKAVLVANYGGGSVASLPIAEDGSLKPAVSVIQHTGSSVNAARQQAPHAHSINLDRANRFAFAADLGLDQILIYKFDPATGKLTPNEPAFAPVAPGSGPRHFAFAPSGKAAFVINELANTITSFKYDATMGMLTPRQVVSTLPKDYTETSYTAEVVVHPSGKFVYGSNRGHDSIAVFVIDKDGELSLVDISKIEGKTPRNFNVDPSGQYLLAEGQASNTVHVFRIDATTGRLQLVGEPLKVPSPVCAKFLVVP